MNGVSDLKLALACHHAGIVPSLVPYSYPDFKQFFSALHEYKSQGGGDIVVSLRFDELANPRLSDKLVSSGISHIEIFDYSKITQEQKETVNQLRKQGIKVLLKTLSHLDIEQFKDILDGVIIKGAEGAGRSVEGTDLHTEIKIISSAYPDFSIVASGGIKNALDVKRLLDAGAVAVGMGTLFAMSKESSISEATKNKILQSTNADIRRLKTGARQRAIVFNEHATDDFNNTQGLYSGLATGKTGHVFVGNALDVITDILSVEEIVGNLISEI